MVLNIINVKYGMNNNYIDITDKVNELFVKENKLLIPKETNFNVLFSDPCFGVEKEITISAIVNNIPINICEKEAHNRLLYDIVIDNTTPLANKYNSNKLYYGDIILSQDNSRYTKIPHIDSIDSFIIVVDFPKYGGGATHFLNTIIHKYKCEQTFLILRNINGLVSVIINEEFILNKQYTEIECIKMLNSNLNKIEKIFVNHILKHSDNFIQEILNINKEKIYITHDYALIFDNPQPIYDDIVHKVNLKQNNFINKFDKIITQHINNVDMFSSFLNNKNKIIVSELPDYKNSFTLTKSDNNTIIIGVTGNLTLIKGSNFINDLNSHIKKHNIDMKIVIFGINYTSNIEHRKYNTISDFNSLLIQYKPNVLLECSIWPETYSYSLTLSMLTQLPILSINKDFGKSVIKDRLTNYNKKYNFDTIHQCIDLVYKVKQNYFYTIEPIIYYNSFWNECFKKTNTIYNFFENEILTNIKNNLIKKIVCFVHFTNISSNDPIYLNIFLDQITYIKSSGLYDKLDYIFVTLLGEFINVNNYDSKIKIIYYSSNIHEWEFPNYIRIKYFCDNVQFNVKILEIHTKGALKKPHSYDWRKYLEYFLIEKHRLCLKALNNYSVVGVNAQYYFDCNKYKNHFSGNFWWANSEYIKKLPLLEVCEDRYAVEHWLIGNLEKYDYRNFLSLHHTEYNLYEKSMNPDDYNHEIIKQNIINKTKVKYSNERTIFGVYFIRCTGNYLNIINDQIQKLINSELYNNTETILCFVSMKTKECLELLAKYDKIKIISTQENFYEDFALTNYKKYLPNTNKYYIYYFHTKGVSKDEKCIHDWRKMCDYFTINKWRLNVELLNYYDCVGVNLKNYPKKHYSGNFWWSKSEHLDKLKNINTRIKGQLSSEMYVLSYMKTNCVSLYQSYVTHGNTEHNESNYNKKSDEEIINNICIIPYYNDGDKHCISFCGVIDLTCEPPILELK